MSSNEEYLDNLLKSMEGTDGTQGEAPAEMADEDIDALFAAAERILNGELAEDEPVAVTYGAERAEAGLNEGQEKQPESEPAVEQEREPESGPTMEQESEGEPEAELESGHEAEVEKEPERAPEAESEAEPIASAGEAQDAYQTVESTRDMSQEEIEALLASTENQRREAAEAEPEYTQEAAEQEDLMALLGGLDSGEDLNAIGDLLEAADGGILPAADANAADGAEDLLKENAFSELEEEAAADRAEAEPESGLRDDIGERSEAAAEDIEADGKRGRKKRERKPKKEKKAKEKKAKEKKVKEKKEKKAKGTEAAGEMADAAPATTEKKQGFFSKLFSTLTEEEESNASDENQAIMQELEEEDLKEAGKKKKLKKGKKPAGGKKGSGEEDEEEEDTGKGKKKAKPKKEPKPKKQKEPKEPKEPEKPGKRISPKSIIVVVLFAATVFGVIFLAVSLFSGELRMQNAVTAFEERNYMVCYEEMYGMDRNEEEERMFRHAEIVLKVQRRITVYEKYITENKELEALDSLLRAVAEYDAVYTRAQECGAGSEVAGLYDRIMQILEENYGIDQDTARAIVRSKSNVDYTRYLTALIAGQGVSTDGSAGGIVLPQEELQDKLPEEEELNQPGFAD